MKKNKMMRLASILLVCVLLSTSVISGTYAKYVTTDSASDSARVAQWGVEVEVSGTLFGSHYYKVNNTNGNKISASAIDSVSSANNVVAPGTENLEGMTFKITGIPEVSGTISAEVTHNEIFLGVGHWGVLVQASGVNEASHMANYYYLADDKYVQATAYVAGTTYYELHDYVQVTSIYYPIVWNGNGNTRLSDFATSLNNTMTQSFAPGYDLNDNTNRTIRLFWVWPFDGVNDKADTILGNLFAGNDDAIVVYSADPTQGYATPATDKYCLDVEFSATITVEQTD